MHVLVCPDKFKGSLTARQVCDAIRLGIEQQAPAATVTCLPMSDGGDGMLDVLVEALDLQLVGVTVSDPLFRPIRAAYGLARDGSTAYVEMARASGLELLADTELDCLQTSTLGTGELIRDALERGVRRVVLGIGGSATNDGGMGMACALGFRLLDAGGRELEPRGCNLGHLSSIDIGNAHPAITQVAFVVASDVQNPLYGAGGAARVFGRQKGADAAAIELLDAGLKNFARVVEGKWWIDLQQVAGAGAAGGLGGGAVAFLGAKVQSGVEMLVAATGLDERIRVCDLVVTGEGRLDEQTLGGKLIDGIIRSARLHHKPVAVICGSSTLSAEQLQQAGISWCVPIMTGNRTLQDAMANAGTYLETSARTLIAAVGEKQG